MKEGVACYRIPALVTTNNGNIIAAIDERVPSCGDLKYNDNINIVIKHSEDNGRTWSEMKTVVDYPQGQSASDPSFVLDKQTGDVFLFYNFMDLQKEKDVYYLKYIKSSDNGKTWSEPVDITEQVSKPGWEKNFKFITSGNGIQTRSGKLLHTIVNLQNGLFVFGSDNHGESWYSVEKPCIPGDESKIVELDDGSWMVNSRVSNKGFRYVHISNDEGKTWTTNPEMVLSDPGCNASIIRYTSVKDGHSKSRLLFSNANSKSNRQNMTIRISYDEGKTWTEGKTIYKGPSAYSTLCILPNGDIGLLYEKDDYKDNDFIRMSLEWLTDNLDKY